jgi:uncharacterized Tic20 family protein
MTVDEELQSLKELHESGGMSVEDYEARKAQLLAPPPTTAMPPMSQQVYAGMDAQTRQTAMFLHLSHFAGWVIPLAGLVAPLIIWQTKKNDMPAIDEHGKVVMNWVLSELIYVVVCVILIFVLIGIPLLMALAVISLVFPIVGGIKANNGELWKYPLSIPFFK